MYGEEGYGYDVMGYPDVMGLSLNPFHYAASAMRMVPGLRSLPGIRRGGPRPQQAMYAPNPMGQMGAPWSPFAMPPLPMGQAMPTARLRSYLGMGALTWGATDATTQSLSVTLQETFRPERLIIVEALTGTPAGLTMLNQVFAGTMPQSPSISTTTPVAMFAANATYSAVDMQIVWRGTQLTVQLSRTAAPGTNNAVTAAVGFYGQWIR